MIFSGNITLIVFFYDLCNLKKKKVFHSAPKEYISNTSAKIVCLFFMHRVHIFYVDFCDAEKSIQTHDIMTCLNFHAMNLLF